MQHHLGTHHFYKRRRKKDNEPSERLVKNFDRVIYVIGTLGPILTIDQVTQIWFYHNAQGVSMLAWGSYSIFSIFWVFYGIIHKQKVLVFVNILWFVVNTLVFVGAYLYH